MSNKNFAGQKLDGRSFRGQDLRGADFSGCSLKSCDFRYADLTGANFRAANFGVSHRWIFLKILAASMIGAMLGFLSIVINLMQLMVSGYFGVYIVDRDWYVIGFAVFYGLGWLFPVFCSLLLKQINSLFVYMASGAVMVAVAGVVTGTLISPVAGVAAMAVAVTGAVAGVVTIAGAGSGVLAGSMAFLVAISGAVAVAQADSDVGAQTVVLFNIIYLMFGYYLRWRAVNYQEPLLQWLRNLSINWSAWLGVRFEGALLKATNFNEAEMLGVDLSGAQFFMASFKGARQMNWVSTVDTPLAQRIVRQMLVNNRTDEKKFAYMNLRGLSLAGMDLSNADFYHADLSNSDLSGCDLRDADLSEVMVLGTRFNGANLTGATIENWGVDKFTRLDGVICEYVYTKRDMSVRNPSHGTFKAGVFSELYQEIANTVDFIVHTPEELQALLRAIESIKQQGGEIFIQSLEDKGNVAILRTNIPAGIDEKTFYNLLMEKKELEKKLIESEYDKKSLRHEIRVVRESGRRTEKILDELLRMTSQSNRPSRIIMNDNSRNITNSPITHSAVNLGDHSTVSNNVIEQVADAQLRTDLQKLHDLLAHSTLPADDKKQAQQSVTELAQASDKPVAERKSIARRSLAFLKELREDLSSMAELGVQYGEVLGRVVLWFQGV